MVQIFTTMMKTIIRTTPVRIPPMSSLLMEVSAVSPYMMRDMLGGMSMESAEPAEMPPQDRVSL